MCLLVDGHPTRRSRPAKAFAAAHAADLRLNQLPGYCPELNTDELLNQNVKTNALWKSRPRTRAEVITVVRRYLLRRQNNPLSFATSSTSKVYGMPPTTLRAIYFPTSISTAISS